MEKIATTYRNVALRTNPKKVKDYRYKAAYKYTKMQAEKVKAGTVRNLT